MDNGWANSYWKALSLFQSNLLICDNLKIWTTLFEQCSIDGKSGVKVKKRHLVAELKLKYNIFNFSSAIRGHFSTFTSVFSSVDPWSKIVIQIFDTSWIDRNFRQNVKYDCFHASCIAGTLKFTQSPIHWYNNIGRSPWILFHKHDKWALFPDDFKYYLLWKKKTQSAQLKTNLQIQTSNLKSFHPEILKKSNHILRNC